MTVQKLSCQGLIDQFVEITGLYPSFDAEYQSELERLIEYLSTQQVRPLEERRKEFLCHTNWKFRLNGVPLRKFYAEAAGEGLTFHYHQKCLIQRSFDLRERRILECVLDERGASTAVKNHLLRFFTPVDEQQTLRHLVGEYHLPSKLRKKEGNRDFKAEIIKAHFSAFMWVSLPPKQMHRFFDPAFCETDYHESFWEQLLNRTPQLFNRDNALHVARIDQNAINGISSMVDVRSAVSELVSRLYTLINNYGCLAIIIEPLRLGQRSIEWEIAADIILFAEKHRERTTEKAYFKWDRVRDQTLAHIPGLDLPAAKFELVNEGFTYRDCFVLASSNGQIHRLLLILQKNERDETPIPCPTCRSTIVQGNSYPSLGVRSWECNNLLCPDRSKYNRGKRYSFRALTMQQAIDNDRNEISVDSVRRWARDIVTNTSDDEVADMLIRHYSMYGDAVHVHNWPKFNGQSLGRPITHHSLELAVTKSPFWDGSFFRRYVVPARRSPVPITNLGDETFQVFLGDSAEVLRGLPASTFDGAVTSPPYYNARDYAQWANMYCYLHDMFDINREVFRTLKHGALYLYNVFDYFDNENTVVFSAMGQRRMLLSAYTVDLFRRIGFELLGNVVWDKGDIEGKRGFNAGNFSPYYQAPFNCWEHVLVFRKPLQDENEESAPSVNSESLVGQVLRQQPVIKMVRGRNVHGHTAPFPDAIPELLISRLPSGAIVLDPFGGSLTTGRVAEKYGLRSVCIERSEEYCRLGLRMRSQAANAKRLSNGQLALF